MREARTRVDLRAPDGADLDALAYALDDQGAFARLTAKLLEDLDLIESEVLPQEDDEGGSEGEGTEEERPDEGDEGEEATHDPLSLGGVPAKASDLSGPS